MSQSGSLSEIRFAIFTWRKLELNLQRIAFFLIPEANSTMEEHKVQALHDTLAKLKKSAGLGVASQYSFGNIKTKQVDGQTVREDGLPSNPLYFPFVKEGLYDPTATGAGKFGNGKVIKRNFDDCKSGSDDEKDNMTASKKSKKKRKSEDGKEKKKAEKRLLKIEAKRQAKLEAKRQQKLEAKRQAKREEKKLARMNTEHHSNTTKKTAEKHIVGEDMDKKSIKKKEKKRKRENGYDDGTVEKDENISKQKAPKNIEANNKKPSTVPSEKDEKKKKKKKRKKKEE